MKDHDTPIQDTASALDVVIVTSEGLFGLPEDILLIVFSYLSIQEQAVLALASKAWRDAIREDRFWKEKFKQYFPYLFDILLNKENPAWFDKFCKVYVEYQYISDPAGVVVSRKDDLYEFRFKKKIKKLLAPLWMHLEKIRSQNIILTLGSTGFENNGLSDYLNNIVNPREVEKRLRDLVPEKYRNKDWARVDALYPGCVEAKNLGIPNIMYCGLPGFHRDFPGYEECATFLMRAVIRSSQNVKAIIFIVEHWYVETRQLDFINHWIENCQSLFVKPSDIRQSAVLLVNGSSSVESTLRCLNGIINFYKRRLKEEKRILIANGFNEKIKEYRKKLFPINANTAKLTGLEPLQECWNDYKFFHNAIHFLSIFSDKNIFLFSKNNTNQVNLILKRLQFIVDVERSCISKSNFNLGISVDSKNFQMLSAAQIWLEEACEMNDTPSNPELKKKSILLHFKTSDLDTRFSDLYFVVCGHDKKCGLTHYLVIPWVARVIIQALESVSLTWFWRIFLNICGFIPVVLGSLIESFFLVIGSLLIFSVHFMLNVSLSNILNETKKLHEHTNVLYFFSFYINNEISCKIFSAKGNDIPFFLYLHCFIRRASLRLTTILMQFIFLPLIIAPIAILMCIFITDQQSLTDRIQEPAVIFFELLMRIFPCKIICRLFSGLMFSAMLPFVLLIYFANHAARGVIYVGKHLLFINDEAQNTDLKFFLKKN